MMKNWLKIASVVLISLLLAAPCFAATYYCDADDGDDSNPGTTGSPWKTIGRAAPQSSFDPNVVSGDTVILRGGYYGALNASSNADWYHANTDWITYIAEDASGDPPLFSTVAIEDGAGDMENAYLRFDGLRFPWVYDGNEVGDVRAGQFTSYAVDIKRRSYFQLLNCYLEGNTDLTNGVLRGKAGSGFWAQSGSGVIQGVLVESCEFTNFDKGFQLTWVGDSGGVENNGIIIRDCNIHHLSEDAITCRYMNNSLIEDNVIGDGWIFGDNMIWDANGNTTGTIEVGDTLTQAGTGATGTLMFIEVNEPDASVAFIYNILGSYTVWDESTIVSTENGGSFIPNRDGDPITAQSYHGDAIQIYTNDAAFNYNVTIRRNKFYNWYQFLLLKQMVDVLVENNLLYGICGTGHGITIATDSKSAIIRNNTCLQLYRSGAGLTQILIGGGDYGGGADNEWKIYNNICSASLTLGASPSTPTGGTQIIHGNLVGSYNDYGYGDGNLPADNTEYDEYPFSEATMAAFFTDPNNDDYTLLSDSDAVDYGDADCAPSTDILGVSRDASPDAGCYEYVSSSGIATLLIIGGALAATSLLVRGCLVGKR